MIVNNGAATHGSMPWNAYGSRSEKKCQVCGKRFLATAEHRYRVETMWLCSYTCFRQAQTKAYKPDGLKLHSRAECIEKIIEKTHMMIDAETPEKRRSASQARTEWLHKLEEVERFGTEAADEARKQA